ncbi:MAG: peptidoglycan DD-metalloendopeptidase family protein [Pseudomonadales bacterium]|nr:peptidoglycan DD-metalloendopeptidase family protein [Pseudomonadales bacterium]
MVIMHPKALILALCLILASANPAFAAKPPSRAELQQLNSHIRATENEINKKKGKSGKLQNTLRKTELDMSKVERDVRQLQQAIATQNKQLKTLQLQQGELNKNRRKLEDHIADQIAASYRLGREEKIKILLNQEDPKKLSRTLTYADYFNKARIASITAYQSTITDLEALKPAIEKKSASLLKNKNQLIAQRKQLKANYAKRSKTLKSINADIKTDQGRLKKLQLDQKHLADLLKAVETTVSNIQLPSDATPFAKRRGHLSWPTKGQLRNRFGRKRPPSNLRWQGISFMANTGKPVKSIHHGRVIFSDWFRGKGLLSIIDHGDGYMSLYAHQQTLLREAGDWVSAGEDIGTVGSSGGIDHTELYFEIRHQGKAINPRRWLKKNG